MDIKNVLNGIITDIELINHYNANISYVSFPKGVNGLVWLYRNTYTIFLKKGLSIEKTKKTLIHELAHIELNQLEQVNKDYLIAFCREGLEDEADIYIKNILKEL